MNKFSKNKKLLVIIGTFFLLSLVFFYWQKEQSRILKIGFVTDWEYSQVNSTKEKAGSSAKDFLSKAIAHYNYFFKPDLVIGGGDYLSGQLENQKETLLQLSEINSIFNKIKADKLYCLGKKDYLADSLEAVKNILGLKTSYYSQITKDIKIIILDTTQNDKTESAQGTIDKNQLDWLKKELSGPLPVLIFSHHSIIEIPLEDVWRQNLTNQAEVLNLIKENKQKIIAVISGNSKNDYLTKESGIPFINIGGLTNKNTLGRFSNLEIIKDKKTTSLFSINLENHGLNSSTYKIKRNLEINTATRISLEKKEQDFTGQRWFDLESSEYPDGILTKGAGGETNIGITENGTVVVGFENKDRDGKIQIKIYKNEQWSNLADKNYPEGLVSLGKGSNVNIETKGEDIFVVFVESDYAEKVRLLSWSESQQKWNELSSQGFLSEKSGHEPTLIFDKKEENLYLAFAEQLQSGKKQTQAVIKKWDGKKWETTTTSLSVFADQADSSVDEFDLVASNLNDSIYIAYEEIKTDGTHAVKVKQWDGLKWNNLKIDKLYFEIISRANGFSPSITVDSNDNLFLSFVEDNTGPIHIYKYANQTNWENLGNQFKDSAQEVIEPFIEIDANDNLYLTYSEYKNNIVMALNNGKKTGEELIKTSAWRVRVQKLEKETWSDCEDDYNYNGYVSKGSGKGDPALKTIGNNLYLIFSDEQNDYAARVKKYLIN